MNFFRMIARSARNSQDDQTTGAVAGWLLTRTHVPLRGPVVAREMKALQQHADGRIISPGTLQKCHFSHLFLNSEAFVDCSFH